MPFKHYLEEEDDKPYFTTNSLGYYYDKMEGFAEKVEQAAKVLNVTKEEVEKNLTAYIEQNKNELDQRLAQWDGKLETFDTSVETLLIEWVDDGTLTPLIDETLINQKISPLVVQLSEVESDTKRKRELEDLSPTVLSAIEGGESTSFNLLSIPQDDSVTPKKTTFFSYGKNLFNPNDENILKGKGFSGSTNAIVDALTYDITDYIKANAGEKIFISSNGVAVASPTWYKIAAYTSTNDFISTQTYSSSGITLPANTSKMRIQVNASEQFLQVEKGTITSYEVYKEPFIKESVLPFIEGSKIKNLLISPQEADFFVVSKNIFNLNDSSILVGKGFSGTTNNVVDATAYNITGLIPFVGGDKVLISSDGVEVTNSSFYKVASYEKNGTFISTQNYVIGGVVTPANTKQIRVHYSNTVSKLQIEKNVVTPYDPFGIYIETKYIKGEVSSKAKGLKLTTYGDSITFRNAWQPYLINQFDFQHTNLGIGSTTLAYVASVETEFPSFVNETRINQIKASLPDILTILGGANDTHRNVPIGANDEFTKVLAEKDKTTYKGAYSFLIETLLTWRPGLEIILLTPTQSNWAYNYEPYAQATRDVAKQYSLPLIDLYAESGISKFNITRYTTDGLHPNDNGGKRIANAIIDKILSNSYV